MNEPVDVLTAKIDEIVENYRGRGYEVEVHPQGGPIVDKLDGFRPDVVAVKGDEVVVLEVRVQAERHALGSMREVAECVQRQPGWKLVLVSVGSPSAEFESTATDQLLPLGLAGKRAAHARGLVVQGEPEAAFMLLWSAVEAALRNCAASNELPIERLQTNAVVKHLYSEGFLTHEQMEEALHLWRIRGELSHGFDATDMGAAFRRLDALAGQISGLEPGVPART